MRAVEAAQQFGGGELTSDHVHAQRAAPGAHRGGGPFLGLQQMAGVRQERLPVDGEPGAARGPGEQPHAQVLFQRGDPLGHRLLRHRQVVGGGGELARARDRGKGAHRIEIHGHRP
jgi:hypothetical protein